MLPKLGLFVLKSTWTNYSSSEDTELTDEINSDDILPYQFEPSLSEDSSSEDDLSDHDNTHNRLLDSSW